MRCRASVPRPVIGEVVFALYLGTSYTRISECFSDSNGLQCAELPLLARNLTGGDMFHLHFEAWDQGPPVYVEP